MEWFLEALKYIGIACAVFQMVMAAVIGVVFIIMSYEFASLD